MCVLHVCLQVAYDVIDVDVPQFQADFSTFKHAIRELEHRLGALIVQVRQACCFTQQSSVQQQVPKSVRSLCTGLCLCTHVFQSAPA